MTAPRGLGRVFDMNTSTQRRSDSNDAAIRQLDAKVGDGAKARSIGPIAFVAATAKDIPHLLGRKLVGWRVSDIYDAMTIIRTASPDETKFLRLTASSNAQGVKIEVW